MKLYRRNTVSRADYERDYISWFASLPVRHQAAVYSYTDYGYRSLNHCLRHGKPLTSNDAEMVSLLDEALQMSTPSEPQKQLLFRGVKRLNFTPVVGEAVTFPYYTSTTSDPHQLFKFVDTDQPIIFEIETELGQKLSDIHPEFEYLLPRNVSFVVDDILEDIDWHAEYEGSDYSRSIKGATVIKLRQYNDSSPIQRIKTK